MLTRLLTITPRCISLNHRKVASCPVKNGEKLSTKPLNIFMKEKFHILAKGSLRPMETFKLLRKQFSALAEEERAKYTNKAKSNAKKVAARREVFKKAYLTGLSHYISTNFLTATRGMKGNGFKKSVRAMKDLTQKWNLLSYEVRAQYNAEAAKLRKSAIAKRDKMMAKYQNAWSM
ncbi:hypothetical protein XU18_3133 [Perkinsela sp. CCAP 1560/4]|nr:hypothetical protein XU18_3133 [Perkinsela sp. CCAP 1560/4]|eukprot:KNH05971.1 hypothetical protein XU18_3133 [Perkinsela sp. CCAP 1560/4]